MSYNKSGNFKQKLLMSLSLIAILLMLTGCLDYKAYELDGKQEAAPSEADLVKEIADVEKELASNDATAKKATETNTDDETNTEDITGAVVANDDAAVEVKSEEAKVEENVEVKEAEVVIPELKETTEAATKPETANTNEEVVVTETPVDESSLQVIKVKENSLVRLNLKVVDPDNDRVTYTFSKPLNQLGEWKTNYGDAGEYMVTILATDGRLTTEKKVKIAVERVNMPPTIIALKDIVVREGQTVEVKPTVQDPNKDKVTVTISEPLSSGLFKTDHTSAGEYLITVKANDGELESTASFKLTVTDVNVLPIVSSVEDSMTIKEGETVKIKPVVTDLDNDQIQLTISEPVGNDGEWKTDYTNHGEYFITVVADDGKDKVSKRIRLVVNDVNMPPEIVDVSMALS